MNRLAIFLLGIYASFKPLQTGSEVTHLSTGSLNSALSWSREFCRWNIFLPRKFELEYIQPNKIFGMAIGAAYTYEKLLPFCKSVRLSGFNGAVLIGISKLKGNAEKRRNKMFSKYNITGIYLDNMRGNEWGQSICRYQAYMEFTDNFAEQKEIILITDVRDVFFQEDPFDSVPFGAKNFLNSSINLLLFQEGLNDISNEVVTLSNTAPNFRWMTNIYGYKVFGAFRYKTPLCSGTTIGTKSGLQDYTRAMILEGYLCLKRNPKKFVKKRGHVCSGGADQGFHNFLFWSKRLPMGAALKNGDGPVYTVGMIRGKPARSLNFDQNHLGEVVSPVQRGPECRVPVIHQWDRHNDLIKYVYEKYDLRAEGLTEKEFLLQLSRGSFTGKASHNSRRGMS